MQATAVQSQKTHNLLSSVNTSICIQQGAREARAAAAAATQEAEGELERLLQSFPTKVATASQQESISMAMPSGMEQQLQQGYEDEPAVSATSAAAPDSTQPNMNDAPEQQLTEEQQQALDDAEALVLARRAELGEAAAREAAAEAAVAGAAEGLGAKHVQYEAYWVEGLSATAAGLLAAVEAGVPLRCVAWVHPAPAAGDQQQQQPVAVRPPEFEAFRSAVAAASWGHVLGSVAAIDLEVGGIESLWAKPASGSQTANPAWAAAATAAREAAIKAEKEAVAATAAAAAAAAAAAPPAQAGKAAAASKPGSAGAPGKPGSAPHPPSAKPPAAGGKDAAAASAAAAIAAAEAAPTAVPGALELGRLVLTVRERLAPAYDAWAARVKVYTLPEPDRPGEEGFDGWHGSSLYRRLLATVPPERQSVPVLMHAMLEQVGRWVGRGCVRGTGCATCPCKLSG